MTVGMAFIFPKTNLLNNGLTVIFIVSKLQNLIIFINVCRIKSVYLFFLINSIYKLEDLRPNQIIISINCVYDLSKLTVLVGRIVKTIKRSIPSFTLYYYKFIRRWIDVAKVSGNFLASLVCGSIVHDYHSIVSVLLL